RYRADHALWSRDKGRFQVRFFHLGLFFKKPVQMFDVVDGVAQEFAYDPGRFDYGRSGLDGSRLPCQLAFAGFQVYFHTDLERDIAACLGAHNFRVVGKEMQLGLSARGLAVDCRMVRREEIPVFTAFRCEKTPQSATSLTVYVMMNSPSITGAYRFDLRPGTT